jgi:hypothetical protein
MPDVLGIDVRGSSWLPRAVRITTAGAVARSWITVPVPVANRLLGAAVRLVADLPAGSTPDVVWMSGGSELLVHTDEVTLTCAAGVVQVGIGVACDQAQGTATVSFALGTSDATRGLFMATYDRPSGPPEVVGVWGEPLTAFAWECLLTLATELAAAAGKDAQGRPLVPGALGAVPDGLQVLPRARTAS